MLEDYRAGLSVDREADRADRLAGRTIGCPTLVLWSSRGDIEVLFGDPLALWKGWTDDLRGTCVESGAQIAEDSPGELVTALTEFVEQLTSEENSNCPRPVQISGIFIAFCCILAFVS